MEVCHQWLSHCFGFRSGWTSPFFADCELEEETLVSLSAVYRDDILKKSTIYRWYNQFKKWGTTRRQGVQQQDCNVKQQWKRGPSYYVDQYVGGLTVGKWCSEALEGCHFLDRGLSLLTWAEAFYACRRNSTECQDKSHGHSKIGVLEVLPSLAELVKQACMCWSTVHWGWLD